MRVIAGENVINLRGRWAEFGKTKTGLLSCAKTTPQFSAVTRNEAVWMRAHQRGFRIEKEMAVPVCKLLYAALISFWISTFEAWPMP
jgi:hypothetical protein